MKNKKINYYERPWGRYFIIEDNNNYKIKRIEVNPKSRLSYQYHMQRSESWTIIKGQGIVTLDGVEYKVSAGESIKINKEAKHRIQNPSDTILIFIEVQTGTYFGEDDIVRIEDDYNRI
ncbi:phosphomannose isomerase type II C-terminal cupin domain [Flavobacteriaceae bacterium]|nr:phosphomannose isomerase type II C-terminal cupin domain [Flavobacteriaceae bacterium]